jgi:type III secretion protein Q
VLDFGGEERGLLEIDPLVAAAALGQVAGTPSVRYRFGQLTKIEEAGLGWVLLLALSAARSSHDLDSSWTPKLLSLHSDRHEVLEQFDARIQFLCVEIPASIGDLYGQARLLVPEPWLRARVDRLPLDGPKAMAGSVGHACLSATLTAGCAQLSKSELADLLVGDVVVFPNLRWSGAAIVATGRVVTPSFTLAGQLTAEGFHFEQTTPSHFQESTMSHESPSPTVDVEIELQRLKLPLSQLGSLTLGAVLPLQISTAHSVTLRIGDRAIARAELVDISGEVGARITELLDEDWP